MDVVSMPQLGETVTEGTITVWRKAVGDRVEIDDALFEVSTEKVDTEVPSATAGFLRAILVAEGEAVAIGTPLAVLTETADEPFDPTGLPGSSAGAPTARVVPSTVPPGRPGAGSRGSGPTGAGADTDDLVRTGGGPAGPGGPGHAVSGGGGGVGPATTRSSDPPRTGSDGDRVGGPARLHPMSAEPGEGIGARGDPGSQEPSRFLSPVVRRLLGEHDLDPTEVAGSGRGGRVTRADVLAAAAQRDRLAAAGSGSAAASPHAPGWDGPVGGTTPDSLTTPAAPIAPATQATQATPADPVASATPTSPTSQAAPAHRAPTPEAAEPAVEVGERDEVVELSRARLATAEHMRRSLDTAAHAQVSVAVDYGAVDAVRRQAGLRHMPFVARAVVDALREFPHMNSVLDGDRLIVRRSVHLGIAVDLDGEALVVPVLRDADGATLRAIAAGVADLAERARRRRLPGDAFTGGTFTLTNVGSFGTLAAAPIINLPQVAILSIDGIAMTPVAVPVASPAPAGRNRPVLGGRAGGSGTDEAGEAGEVAWAVAVRPVGNLSLSFDHRAVDGAYAAAFLARVRDLVEHRDWSAELGGAGTAGVPDPAGARRRPVATGSDRTVGAAGARVEGKPDREGQT